VNKVKWQFLTFYPYLLQGLYIIGNMLLSSLWLENLPILTVVAQNDIGLSKMNLVCTYNS
jgi:hypothetical protein